MKLLKRGNYKIEKSYPVENNQDSFRRICDKANQITRHWVIWERDSLFDAHTFSSSDSQLIIAKRQFIMNHEDIITLLYSASGVVYTMLRIFNMSENKLRFSRPRRERLMSMTTQSLKVKRDPHERQQTVKSKELHNSVNYKPGLRLTFSEGPKTQYELIPDSNSNNDLVLPHMNDVSFNHFVFRFDDNCF